jgi:hypothetical protein
VFPNPNALIYNCVSVLQTWAVAVKELDRGGLEKIAEELTKRMEEEREEAGVG